MVVLVQVRRESCRGLVLFTIAKCLGDCATLNLNLGWLSKSMFYS